MTNDEKLFQYYQMLFPDELKEDEYIRLTCIKKDEDKVELGDDAFTVEHKNCTFIHLVNNFQEYKEVIKKYKYVYNIYNNISTVKCNGETYSSGTKEHMRQRRVLFLDFDKKDYPALSTAEQFTDLVKDKVNLFIQCMVDTGNGYHMYISIKPTCDKKRLQI